MGWFGKMVGGTVGLMIGGPLGAIAGAALGHHFIDVPGVGGTERIEGDAWSRRTARPGGIFGVENRQATFYVALFSMLGKIAKADGKVTRAEGDVLVSFLDEMGIRGQERQFAIKVFNEAKHSPYRIGDFARQFVGASRMYPQLRANLLDMLFRIALADGTLVAEEEEQIEEVARIFGLGSAEIDQLRRRYVGDADRAYSVLGVESSASDSEVRSAYRRLVQENHPDTVIGQGLPEEFVEHATKRFQEVQAAWETIKRERGIS